MSYRPSVMYVACTLMPSSFAFVRNSFRTLGKSLIPSDPFSVKLISRIYTVILPTHLSIIKYDDVLVKDSHINPKR